MSKEEIIEVIHKTMYQFFDVCGDNEEVPMTDKDELLLSVNKAICNNIKALEQPCEDAISRKKVLNTLFYNSDNNCEVVLNKELQDRIKSLPPVKPTQKWIPVSEGLPKEFEFVNCTCHSLIDDRDDWVVETVYIPQFSDSPYSDWGNIPMLNCGDCEVVAWMHREIPEPYKTKSEG